MVMAMISGQWREPNLDHIGLSAGINKKKKFKCHEPPGNSTLWITYKQIYGNIIFNNSIGANTESFLLKKFDQYIPRYSSPKITKLLDFKISA